MPEDVVEVTEPEPERDGRLSPVEATSSSDNLPDDDEHRIYDLTRTVVRA